MKDNYEKQKSMLLEIRKCFKERAEGAEAMAEAVRQTIDPYQWKVLDDRTQNAVGKITIFESIRDASLEITYLINKIIEIETRIIESITPDFDSIQGASDVKNKH